MGFWAKQLATTLVGLMTVLACGTAQAGPVRTDSVSNTARLEWSLGTGDQAPRAIMQSNTVVTTVERAVPGDALRLYKLAPGATGTTQLPAAGGQCLREGVIENTVLTGAYANTPLDPASVNPTPSVRPGDPLVISVESITDNRDPSRVDMLDQIITSSTGDEEHLRLAETGPDTGIFTGVIRTNRTPPAMIRENCVLSLGTGGDVIVTAQRLDGTRRVTTPVELLIDPYGFVFDSVTGQPVNGARVTLVDADTGRPAVVFGDDAVSSFPSTLMVGQPVTDASGRVYDFDDGGYRFPFARPGRYRVQIELPPGYTAPSKATAEQLAGFSAPDGVPYLIVDGSYGRTFVLEHPDPVRIDIPIDPPPVNIAITKAASKAVARPGDAIQYRLVITNGEGNRPSAPVTLNDRLPDGLRLVKNSVRLNGQPVTAPDPEGRAFRLPVGKLSAGQTIVVTYLLEVLPGARAGAAVNRAQIEDWRGATSPVAEAIVRIERDLITERMTIIGTVREGGCGVKDGQGLPGIRVMLEDGSYTITDAEGRYHFEGLMPGHHVVQIDPATAGPNRVAVDCRRNTRSAGNALSAFVDGQGGALQRADFTFDQGENTAVATPKAAPERPEVIGDPAAAGAERDWLVGQEPGVGFVFPEIDHNPRTQTVRVVVKHAPDQSVALSMNGTAVSALHLDGSQVNDNRTIAMSIWRAVPITRGPNQLQAVVRDAKGQEVARLNRTVYFSGPPTQAEFVPERSHLVADGVSRPVIAIRLKDRHGRPAHHGMIGDFDLPSPYRAAVAADAQQVRQLSGLDRARAFWKVEGDEGLAYIELEPTTASGEVILNLTMREGDAKRVVDVKTWLQPGDQPWTIVGFAAGTVGFNRLSSKMERLGANDNTTIADGRIAFYAKGRVQGKWLLTLAYDTDKKVDETRYNGTIDPNAYYTVYGDASERRYDAASRRKLYVRVERRAFYALFGDFASGMTETQLGRYARDLNGLKAQYAGKSVNVSAFAADTPLRHNRVEIQGAGTTGPYELGARDILPNSERIVVEVRDRLQSNLVKDVRTLARYTDYEIDYARGRVILREPLASRSFGLDPQFLIVDYEVDGFGQKVTSAGGRASWTGAEGKLRVGASALSDRVEGQRTNLGGGDIRYKVDGRTEVRAELALSNRDPKGQNAGVIGRTDTRTAWLVEAEHHGERVDLLAYARSQDEDFGVGQQVAWDRASRRYGLDAGYRAGQTLLISGRAWVDTYQNSPAQRTAGEVRADWRTKFADLFAGLVFADDKRRDDDRAKSLLGEVGASKAFLNGRLNLNARTQFKLGHDGSTDFPVKHSVGAKLAIVKGVSLIGAFEWAKGDDIKAHNARVGFELAPWTGARLLASTLRQQIGESGARTYASFGLAQSLPIGKNLMVDVALDSNRAVDGIDPDEVVNPLYPVSSGGFLSPTGELSENFTALSAGATYRAGRLSITGRGEYRSGSLTDRSGVTIGLIRQLADGIVAGGAFNWRRASRDDRLIAYDDDVDPLDEDGPTENITHLAFSWAFRPPTSRWSILNKLEARREKMNNAVAGLSGPIGGPALTFDGDTNAKRIMNTLAINWSPMGKNDKDRIFLRPEISLFWGARYVFTRFDDADLKGWSHIVGLDARFDFTPWVDFGFAGSLRQSARNRSHQFAIGPMMTLSPVKNSAITLGYNITGFRDRDYKDARYTHNGPYIMMQFKFDQTTFDDLGIKLR